jgi:RNA polymerase primary sigma factor
MRVSQEASKGQNGRAGNEALSSYLKEIGVYRLLSRAEEAELAVRIHAGDQDALNALVCGNLRFVVSVAKKYRHQGVSFGDLIDEGNFGLMQAARRFDETRGIKFISYAVWWVRQAIVEALADQSRIVRVPLGRLGALYQMDKQVSALAQELGRTPTNSEVAAGMNAAEGDIADTVRLARGYVSLDAPAADDTDTSLLDLIADDSVDAPDEPVQTAARTDAVQRALSMLPPREAKVIRMYFGLTEGEPATLEEIGALFGVTRERVRQIRDRALSRLRKSQEAPILRALAS